jgi:hypothetical protein
MKKMTSERYTESLKSIQLAHQHREEAYKHMADLLKRADGNESLRYAEVDIRLYQQALEFAIEYSVRVYQEEGIRP